MEKEDLRKIIKWVGYVYLPIVLLIVGIYLFVQYREYEIAKAQSGKASTTIASTTLPM